MKMIEPESQAARAFFMNDVRDDVIPDTSLFKNLRVNKAQTTLANRKRPEPLFLQQELQDLSDDLGVMGWSSPSNFSQSQVNAMMQYQSSGLNYASSAMLSPAISILGTNSPTNSRGFGWDFEEGYSSPSGMVRVGPAGDMWREVHAGLQLELQAKENEAQALRVKVEALTAVASEQRASRKRQLQRDFFTPPNANKLMRGEDGQTGPISPPGRKVSGVNREAKGGAVMKNLAQIVVTEHKDPVVAGATKVAGQRWTAKQDEQLRWAVEHYKASNWKQIAECVEGRTHVQCLQRWKKVLQPGLIKGTWSPEEDAFLLALIQEQGEERSWSTLAERMPGRTAKQCRERWFLNLDPEINHSPWTKEEDDILVRMHLENGNKWSLIRSQLPGRTENSVKSRFKSLVRAIKRSGGKAGA